MRVRNSHQFSPSHFCIAAIAAVSLSCGQEALPSFDADAGLVNCEAAPAARPLPLRGAVYTPQALEFRAGPVALPPNEAQKLGPVTQRRPQRAPFRSAIAAPRIAQRTLVLSAVADDPTFLAARTALERVAAAHEIHVALSTPFSSIAWFEADGTCRYSSIIVSTDMLGYYDEATDGWLSALTEEQWAVVAAYEVSCGAREAIWYAYPQEDIGLELLSSFDADTRETGILTGDGKEVFPYIVADPGFAVERSYGYRSRVIEPSTTVPLVVTPEGDALVVRHQRSDGTEVIAVTMSGGEYSLHAQLLDYGLISWLQRGLFVGERRVYLTPQMDDIYLYTDLWKIGASSAAESDSSYRTTVADIDSLVAWQRALQQRLPPGSSFVTQLPFNGAGSLPAVYPSTGLVAALDAISDEFVWINHTWDHQDMDELSAAEARTEMSDNCDLGRAHAFERFSCDVAITPHVSGLDNPSAVEGMLLAGVRTVVSDTSVTELVNPANPGTNPSHNVGRRNPSNPALFHVPRHPTGIYYNTSLDTEEVDLYNLLNREWNGRDLDYQEILEKDTEVALSYLLSFDIDPLMFHQGNLRFWTDNQGEKHSLYTDWVDLLIDRFVALVDLPIVTVSLSETAIAMQRRDALNGCGASVVLVDDELGRRLEVSTGGFCVVPITGVAVATAGDVRVYGGIPTTFVAPEPCVPLVVPLE